VSALSSALRWPRALELEDLGRRPVVIAAVEYDGHALAVAGPEAGTTTVR
jgi:hypothetical protein